jgi:hypothetical protein
VCYERGWEAQKRNEAATEQIRLLFARYRSEAERARLRADDARRRPATPVVRRERDRETALL